MRIAKYWKRMPRDVVEAPALEAFKGSNLVKLEMSLITAGGLEKMAFQGPFQPNAFCV